MSQLQLWKELPSMTTLFKHYLRHKFQGNRGLKKYDRIKRWHRDLKQKPFRSTQGAVGDSADPQRSARLKEKCWVPGAVVALNKYELLCWASLAATTPNEDVQTWGQAALMMFWAPCDGRLIPDQLLMVLIVNKQVTASRSEFCREMDEQLSAPASQRPVLNHLPAPTPTPPPTITTMLMNRHRWRVWPGLLLQEPATTFYISPSVSEFVSSSAPYSRAHNMSVCLRMATSLCDALAYFQITQRSTTTTTH